MGFDLKSFYQTITRYGLARDNLLRVEEITGFIDDKGTKQGGASNIFPFNEKDKNFYVYLKTASLPNRRIATGAVAYKSFTFQVPLEASYLDAVGYNVEFYCDKYSIIRDIFERWSNATYNEHQNVASCNWGKCNLVLSLLDNSDAEISLANMKAVKKYTLFGCFPNRLEGITHSTSSAGAIVTQRVSLNYQYVVAEDVTE
jgi:hypothetical protein